MVGLPMDLQTMLKAMADETRYAIYRHLAALPGAIGANDLADRLGLHANTVRLHLERMRDAGLVAVEAVHRGTVGRPQHVYALAAGAPRSGFAQPSQGVMEELLAALAERAGADADLAVATGRAWGAEAGRRAGSVACVEALAGELDRLGFDPEVLNENGTTCITFSSCPFRGPADAYPDLVCNLHRGICEGVVEGVGGGTVEAFTTLSENQPCRVTVAVGVADRD